MAATASCVTAMGHRAIQTGVGPVEVRRAKVRDRGKVGAAEKIRFTSSILPKWARRGLRGLAEARSLGAALRVCVGGRGLPAGADGSRRRMHAGADRRDTRGQERAR